MNAPPGAQISGIAPYAPLIVDALTMIDDIVLVLAPPVAGRRLPRILAANEAFLRICGPPRRPQGEANLDDFLAPATSPATVTDLETAVAIRKPLRTEIELRGRGEGTVWLGFHLTPMFLPETTEPCFVLIGKDVTERERRAQASQETARIFTSAFLNADAAVAVATSTRVLVVASRAFHFLFGATANSLTGHNLDELFEAETAAQLARATAACLAGETVPPCEAHCRRADGARFVTMASLTLIEGDGGRRLITIALHRTLQSILAPAQGQVPAAADARAVSKIRLIGLSEVRAAFGEHWAGIATRAMMLAETVIKRRLCPEDIFSRTVDEGFLIWFDSGDADEISRRVERIVREIRIVLLTEFADSMVATVTSATVPFAQDDDTAEAVEKVHRATATLPDRRTEEARQYLASVEREVPIEVEPLFGRGGQPLPASCCRLSEDARAKLETALARLGHETAGKAEAELLTLRAAVARTAPQRSCFVTLAFSSFILTSAREHLFAALKALDPATAKRLTVLFAGEFEEISRSRLFDIGSRLRPLVRAVGLDGTIDLARPPFTVATCGTQALGVAETEAQLWESITAAHQAGTKVIAIGARTATDGRKLIELGADFIAGVAPTNSLAR